MSLSPLVYKFECYTQEYPSVSNTFAIYGYNTVRRNPANLFILKENKQITEFTLKFINFDNVGGINESKHHERIKERYFVLKNSCPGLICKSHKF